MQDRNAIVIVGPTASGKTGYSIHLAHLLNTSKSEKLSFSQQCEIISADSRQIYRGMDVGTGKVTHEEMSGIPHHMLDIVNPGDVYSAHRFATEARVCMEEIWARGSLPIICGGTGLYIDALFGRVELGEAGRDDELRAKLETKSVEELLNLLRAEDPQRAANIERKSEEKNKVRLVRAIEVARDKNINALDSEKLLSKKSSGRPARAQPDYFFENFSSPSTRILWLGLRPTPTELRANIKKRLLERLDAGMLEEVKRLHAGGLSWETMETLGLEYRYCARHLRGLLRRTELEIILEQKIWQYAKRQINWWKRNDEIQWFHPSERERMDEISQEFLKK